MSKIEYSTKTTDELYELMPSMIRFQDNKFIGDYHLRFFKGMKGTVVYYEDSSKNCLGSTSRRNYDFRQVLITMLEWLDKFKYTSNERD
jgi:hypothetical protein